MSTRVSSSGVTKETPNLSSVKRGRESVFGSADSNAPTSPTKRSRVSPRDFVVVNGVKYYASRSPSPPTVATTRRRSPFPVRLHSTSPVPHLDSSCSPVILPTSFPSATPVSVRADPIIRTPSKRRIAAPRSRSSSYEIPDISEILRSSPCSTKSTPSPNKRVMFSSPSALPPPLSPYPSPSGVSPKRNNASRSSVSKSSTVAKSSTTGNSSKSGQSSAAGRALRDAQIREAMQSAIEPQKVVAVDVRSGTAQCVSIIFLLRFHLNFFF